MCNIWLSLWFGKSTLNKYSLPLLISLFISLNFFATQAAENDVHLSVFKQEYDWLKLSSDEWLKGDILSMYDDELEFNSKELDLQTINWDDVVELRSKDKLSIRLADGTITEGFVVITEGQLRLVNDNVAKNFPLSDLFSITASSERERDLWDGYLNLGANFRRGNTEQFDYTIGAGVQRRSPASRLKIDYIANYSTLEDQETDEKLVTTDSARLTSIYDWFLNQKIFLRAMDFEHFSDEFLNIDYRVSYGIAAGYHLIDKKKVSWDVNLGPSYQKTKFISVSVDDANSETSPGLALGTDFSYEITSDIDFDASYQVKIVNEASGEYIHHFETGLEVELTSKFDLDLTLYIDRTEIPHADESDSTPEQNDYRFVVSLKYDF